MNRQALARPGIHQLDRRATDYQDRRANGYQDRRPSPPEMCAPGHHKLPTNVCTPTPTCAPQHHTHFPQPCCPASCIAHCARLARTAGMQLVWLTHAGTMSGRCESDSGMSVPALSPPNHPNHWPQQAVLLPACHLTAPPTQARTPGGPPSAAQKDGEASKKEGWGGGAAGGRCPLFSGESAVHWGISGEPAVFGSLTEIQLLISISRCPSLKDAVWPAGMRRAERGPSLRSKHYKKKRQGHWSVQAPGCTAPQGSQRSLSKLAA